MYNPTEMEFKLFQDKDENKFIVSCVQMFKEGILPAWEDPVNKDGSEFRIDIPKYSNGEVIQNVWQQLVMDMLTGEMPHVTDGVAGVRLVVKAKNFNFQNFRIELWMSQKDEENEVLKDLKDYLQNKIVDDILAHETKDKPSIRYESRGQK